MGFVLLVTLTATLAQDASTRFEIDDLTYAPDGDRLAIAGGPNLCKEVADDTQAVRVVDSETGHEVMRLIGHYCSVNSVSWSPTGEYLITSSGDGSVRIWNARTGQQIIAFGKTAADGEAEPFYGADWNPVTNIAVSFDGVGVSLYRFLTDDSFNSSPLIYAPDIISEITWSADGCHLAAATRGDSLQLWDINFPEQAPVALYVGVPTSSIAWSPDGTALAVGDFSGSLHVLSATGEPIAQFSSHTDTIMSIAWNQDGSLIATGGDDTVRLWNAVTGELLSTLVYPGAVHAVAWHPTEAVVAIGGGGRTAASAEVSYIDIESVLATLTPAPINTPQPSQQ